MPINLTVMLDQNGVPVLSQAKEAIASIESAGSGGYSAIGPKTKSGDRAYGRYQVMGVNIPSWTKAALGRSLTPEQFLASPEAQDAVFNHQFGGYLKQYSPQDAASMWFSGRPMNKAGNASDVGGTTVPQYVNKFNAAMGNPTQIGPVSTRFGLPVQPVGDVIDAGSLFRRSVDQGTNLAQDPLGPGRMGLPGMGGGVGSFGPKWRDRNYAAQQFGVPVENVKPIESPSNVIGMPKPASQSVGEPIQASATIKNWLSNPDVVKMRIPQRVADAVKERPELRKMLGEWVSSISSADPSLQGRYISRLSEILSDAGYK